MARGPIDRHRANRHIRLAKPFGFRDGIRMTRGALFAFMHDSPPEWEEDLNRYLDLDHIPDRLSCEGWGEAQRFVRAEVRPAGVRNVADLPKYLYLHELNSLAALTSPSRTAFEGGSPWSRAQRSYQRSTGVRAPSIGLRTAWTPLPSPWRPPVHRMVGPRAVYIVLQNVASTAERDFNSYLDEEFVPELLSSPGFLACQRFVAGPPLTPVQHEGEFVSPKYLNVFDVVAPEVLSSAAYRIRIGARSARQARLDAVIENFGAGVYVQRPSPWKIELIERPVWPSQ